MLVMVIILFRFQHTDLFPTQDWHIYNESVMAPPEPNVDYYAVLEISNIATVEVVTKSYPATGKDSAP